MKLLHCFVLLFFAASSCTVFKGADARRAKKIEQEITHSTVFEKGLTGFILLDPATGKALAKVNSDHYFTPASNVKIFTLATCLSVLGDSLPGIKTASHSEEGIFLKPTGDPTFLHPKFQDWQPVFEYLNGCYGPTTLLLDRFSETRLGPGWAWDDYNEAFSPERTAMPIFGNVMSLQKHDSTWVLFLFEGFDRWGWNLIQYDTTETPFGRRGIQRDEHSNLIYIPKGETFDNGYAQNIPILFNDFSLHDLLRDTLRKSNIYAINTPSPKALTDTLNWHTVYSAHIDTVLRRMMHQSDNFIAEQLLLVCAGEKFDLLKQSPIIDWALDSVFYGIAQRPRWVDGSGLSRYNLATPQSIAQVLLQLWKGQPHTRLFSLFPSGGYGTLQGWYAGKEGVPYVWAKSGSMSGVQCLSGYVQCKSGKVLIFSFMHNNFVGSGRPWKVEMERVLTLIHHRF